jgi:hypothetical protein
VDLKTGIGYMTKKTLETDFNELAIIFLKEKLRKLDEGPMHQGMAELIQMKAKKQE